MLVHRLGAGAAAALLALSTVAQLASAQVAESDTSQAPSPRGALLRSLALPGWGQLANGERLKAAAIALSEIGLTTAVVIQNRRVGDASGERKESLRGNRNTLFFWLVGAVVYSALDAYVDAHFRDVRFPEGEATLELAPFAELTPPPVPLPANECGARGTLPSGGLGMALALRLGF